MEVFQGEGEIQVSQVEEEGGLVETLVTVRGPCWPVKVISTQHTQTWAGMQGELGGRALTVEYDMSNPPSAILREPL